MNAVEFRNVVKSFGGVKVLDGVSFEVKKGDIFAIVGPSGTGKSVSLKHIASLLQPDSGEVWVSSGKIGYLLGRDEEVAVRCYLADTETVL